MQAEAVALPSEDRAMASTRWTITMAAAFGWFFDGYVITIYALTVPLIAAVSASARLAGGEEGTIMVAGLK
jgi:hypothetical protein